MIELSLFAVFLVFLCGFLYAVCGMATERFVREELDRQLGMKGANSLFIGTYAAAMVYILWPVLAFLIVIATAFVTLSDLKGPDV